MTGVMIDKEKSDDVDDISDISDSRGGAQDVRVTLYVARVCSSILCR